MGNLETVIVRNGDSEEFLEVITPYSERLVECSRKIPTRKWDAEKKLNLVHINDLPLLKDIFAGYALVVNPSTIERYNTRRHREEELLNLKKFQNIELTIPNVNLSTVKNYQKTGIKFLSLVPQALLADEMGLGKSLMVLATLQMLRNEGKINKILFLCPTSLKINWQREASKWVNIRPMVVSGDFEERKATYDRNPDALIVGYHSLISSVRKKILDANGFPVLDNKGVEKIEITYKDYPEIVRWKPDAIVCDECARMAEWKNSSSKLLSGLLSETKAKHLYLISGTPFENMRNLYGMIKLLNKNIFGSYAKFQEAYCHLGGYTGYEIIGRKNMGMLQERIAPIMLRRLKKDVLKELPDKIYQQYDIEMSPEQKRIYDELEVLFETQVDDQMISMPWVFQRIVAFKHLCDAPQLVNPKVKINPKMDELKKLVKELAPEHKIVIFSQFKEVTDIIVEEFKDEYDYVYLHGQVKEAEKRQALVDYFQGTEDCRLFISTLQAGGLGLNLTASDVVIFYDKWWSIKMNAQAEDRVHRIGQTNAPIIISLIMNDSIEDRVEELLREKKGFVDEVFQENSSDEEIVKKLSGSQLRKLIGRRKKEEV